MPLVSGDGVPLSVCAFLMLRVPESCSQFATRERHKKPPAGAGEDVSREPAASCRSSLGGPPPACRQPGPPGLALPQKAPGGSRGTPGRMPSRVPCDVGLNRDIACRHPAWTAGWFSCPVSPGFHPGLLGRATRPIPNSKDLQTTVASEYLHRPGWRCRGRLPAFKAQPAPATMAVQGSAAGPDGRPSKPSLHRPRWRCRRINGGHGIRTRNPFRGI